MAVDCAVEPDDGQLVVRLTGRLDLTTVHNVRVALLKCLAEQPDALLIDLARLTVVEPLGLAVFLTITRQARLWPGTPVLLCAPSSPAQEALRSPAFHRLPVFASVEDGRADLRNQRLVLPSLGDELLPVAGAARQARNVATEACIRWELPQLTGPASVVAGELASNGVVHAGTMMTLRFTLSHRYLHIAVRDGSAAAPRLSDASVLDVTAGRGLRLVDALARSWGHIPTDGGKVVWAALDLDGG